MKVWERLKNSSGTIVRVLIAILVGMKYAGGCVVATFFAAIAIVAGTFLLFFWIKARRTETWEKTPAYVLSTYFHEEMAKKDVDKNRHTSQPSSINFQYSFSGKEYFGEKVTDCLPFVIPRRLESEMTEIVLNGDPVSAYVNPSRPEEAVLVRAARIYARWSGIVCFFCACISMGFFWLCNT